MSRAALQRRHYEWIAIQVRGFLAEHGGIDGTVGPEDARVLRERLAVCEDPFVLNGFLKHYRHEVEEAVLHIRGSLSARDVVHAVARALYGSNDNFDRGRFMDACDPACEFRPKSLRK